MKGLTLNTKEQARLQILNAVLEGRWSMGEAAEVLVVSERHAWRILAAYRKEGAAALAHGNRGRLPRNATPALIGQPAAGGWPWLGGATAGSITPICRSCWQSGRG